MILSRRVPRQVAMPSKLVTAPLPADVFKPDIFKGKVLFCTGGGSGIGKAMTEAVVLRDFFAQCYLISF